jgi:hypothetical protein
MQRWDIINHLIKENNYRSYLEIGYYKGWSFDLVKLSHNKTAVDPNPSKTSYQESLEYGKIDHTWCCDELGLPEMNYDYKVIKLTSDDYFSKIKEDRTWDIVFIDGLHESSQVERDIQNSLKHLSEGGTIVLHDMLPPTLEHTTTGKHGNWNGDCYKALLKFVNEDKFGRYTVRIVDTDWGCGIIQKSTIALERMWKDDEYNKAINDFNYFQENKDKLFNIITPEEFLTLYSK